MIAEKGGKLVAKFIDKRWPEDREDIFEILTLGINKACNEGSWLGMAAEFSTDVYKDESGNSYFMSPQSHPVLLACNMDGKPVTLRDKYFTFHKNGNGDVKDAPGCKWRKDVQEIGYTPYFDKNNIKFSDGVILGVRALGQPGPDEKIYINGTYQDGEKVFTYGKSDFGSPCGCSVNPDEETRVETINGIRIDIKPGFQYISNIKFSSITSIVKTATRTPIEVVAITEGGNAFAIARLDPNTQESKYRKYLAPDYACSSGVVHGIFKIAEQEDIVNNSDVLVISNKEALICFAKGIYNIYYKEQPELGAAYILQGISILEKEKREQESPSQYPIQVDGIYDGDLPQSLQYSS